MCIPRLSAQDTLRKVINEAFLEGEYLKYSIYYGWFDAGEAVMEVKKQNKTIKKRPCYHINAIGYSIGLFEWFFRVRDYYYTYLDKEALVPWEFYRDVYEGGYEIVEHLRFDHYNNMIQSLTKEYKVPDNTQDIISAFYYARCINYSKAKPGDIFPIPFYVLEDEVFPLELEYVGKEQIETDLGIFNCYVIKPLLQEGRVFSGQQDMTMWISDDKNNIPIRVETVILVGSMNMDLIEYKNLRNPINKASSN
ncbi:DUF3108 domain-containing protein [Candidatus Amoebophilus asiaticus]|nr:DUF3108 domain-containing protein [Candidatus Amoebophilus asiaticus]